MSLFGKQKDENGQPGRDDANARAAVNTPSTAAPRNERSTPEPSSGKSEKDKGNSNVANIGKSISIKGDLTGNEDIVIEGTVEGRVDLPDNQLTVGANGNVRAEITAKAVIVVGKVTGNVRGTDRIEIQATGSVEGDVSAPRLVVAEGAVLNGSIEMGASASTSKAKATPPPTEAERKAG